MEDAEKAGINDISKLGIYDNDRIDTLSKPTECTIETRDICTGEKGLVLMKKYIEYAGDPTTHHSSAAEKEDDPEQVLAQIMRKLGVDSESAIWKHKDFQQFVSYNTASKFMKIFFKPHGPRGSTKLLNNFNIDNVLAQWKLHSEELFKCKFQHIPFQMIDFNKDPTNPLACIDLMKLSEDFDCFGVVLNSDVSTGTGKHWFCLYADLKNKNMIEIEYFNSSGRPPYREILEWYESLRRRDLNGPKIEITRAITRTIQKSHTECGMWSLMYIKGRLLGNPPGFIAKYNDMDMIKLRDNVFTGS